MATARSLTVVVSGASGFLGTHLVNALRERGHHVVRLVRRTAKGPEESTWDPDAGVVDTALIGAADVVVNLGGAPLIGNVHSQRWERAVLQSRVATTTTLATTVAAVATPPALLNASGVSWYGDHGAEPLSEASDTRGHAFLTRVAREWEAATAPAVAAGARVVLLRTAPVQDRRNAPLQQLRLQFAAGAGGRLGNGRQHMAMISLRDWVRAVVLLAEHDDAAGPVNLCAPRTPTNAEFTRTLARLLHRPALLAVPAPAIRLAAGPMADEVLGSLNLRPQALLDLGYEFADPDVAAVLASGLAARDA